MKAQAEADSREPERPEDAFFAAALLAKLGNTIITENKGNIAINSPGAVQTGTLKRERLFTLRPAIRVLFLSLTALRNFRSHQVRIEAIDEMPVW